MSLQPYTLLPVLTPVRLVATSNQSGTYYNGPLNNGVGATFTYATGALTIDSVTVNVGDRILFSAQSSALQNGIYVCVQSGATGIAAILQRSSDMQCIEQMHTGFFVNVAAGTANNGAAFTLVEPKPGTVGIDAIIWQATPNSGVSPIPLSGGGTGATNGPAALTSFGVKRGTTAAYAGGGTSNAFTATGLASTDIVVATILASTNSVSITKAVPTANTLTVTFSADPGAATTVQWHALPA